MKGKYTIGKTLLAGVSREHLIMGGGFSITSSNVRKTCSSLSNKLKGLLLSGFL